MSGTNQTLVQLLEHSSGCDSMVCNRESDCKKMKQIIHHTLLCKQVACKICFEVNTLVQCHSNACPLELCPVMTCSTLRQYSQYKGTTSGALSSYSNDLIALASLKHKCKANGGIKAKVRGTYQCGRCGMPKIRPHKCGEQAPDQVQEGLDTASEEDQSLCPTGSDSILASTFARKPAEARVIASARADVLRSQSLDERGMCCEPPRRRGGVVQRSVSIDLPARPRAPTASHFSRQTVYPSVYHRGCEDSQESVLRADATSTRKRAASPDESFSGMSRRRFETAGLCAGVATIDPRKQLSRCPSFASDLSEESDSSSQVSDPSAETVATFDESQEFTQQAKHVSDCRKPAHWSHPAYPPPPPPGFWMPRPGADFTQPLQPPSQSYGMIQIQDPFGRSMMVPYWGPPPGFVAPILRTQSQGAEGERGNEAARSHTPLPSSSIRRRFAHSRGCSPEDPPTPFVLCNVGDASSNHLHGNILRQSITQEDSADTTTDPSLDSLEVQHRPTSTSTSAALHTEEADAELELDLDAFALDLSVSFTPTSAVGIISAPRTGTTCRSGMSSRYSDTELFQYLNEELVAAY